MRWRSSTWPARCWWRWSRRARRWRNTVSAARPSFSARHESLRRDLITVQAAMKRAVATRNRLLASRARNDTRVWQVKRRERTRQLIELGGLVAKSGLIELTEDDRAVIFGVLVEAAAKLRADEREQCLLLWRRRGKRGFEQ